MEKVFGLLRKAETMTLATSSNDKPRASVLTYYVVCDNVIVFGTDPNSIKGVNLKSNKRISLSVFNQPELVTIDGVVTEANSEEIEEFMKLLLENHPEFKEMTEQDNWESVYYKVVIETAYYSDFRTGSLEAEVIKA